MTAYWIKSDIDGVGRKWRIVVERNGRVYWPMEDFEEEMTLDEYREEFPKNQIVEIAAPPK